jgi:ribonuclease P protein component
MTDSIGRIKIRPDFLRAARSRRKWVAPGLILQARRRAAGEGVDPEAGIRVGFTASRKVGSAVERNRARRRLRAAVAEVLPELGEAGHDYVMIARRATLSRAYGDLLEDLRIALKRLAGERRYSGQGRPQGRSASGKRGIERS